MKIIFGLGNPGTKYQNTFHNLGFIAIDILAEKLGVAFNKKSKKGIYGEKIINGEKVLLVKPQTFMNLSGECVREFYDFFKCDTKDILVIYDDIDIDKGFIRYRPHGSAGTHNGMRSIINHLGLQDFKRIRIGAKNTNPNIPLIEYVLMNIPKEDHADIAIAVNRGADCALAFANGKTDDQIMCEFNKN